MVLTTKGDTFDCNLIQNIFIKLETHYILAVQRLTVNVRFYCTLQICKSVFNLGLNRITISVNRKNKNRLIKEYILTIQVAKQGDCWYQQDERWVKIKAYRRNLVAFTIHWAMSSSLIILSKFFNFEDEPSRVIFCFPPVPRNLPMKIFSHFRTQLSNRFTKFHIDCWIF